MITPEHIPDRVTYFISVGFIEFTELSRAVEVTVSIDRLNVIWGDDCQGLASLAGLGQRERQTLHYFLVPPLSLWLPDNQNTNLQMLMTNI